MAVTGLTATPPSPSTHAPSAILVLGMHRSGTSALAGSLALTGVALGDDLLPANEGNVTGYWEHRRLIALNERVLASLGATWHDIRHGCADLRLLPGTRPGRRRAR